MGPVKTAPPSCRITIIIIVVESSHYHHMVFDSGARFRESERQAPLMKSERLRERHSQRSPALFRSSNKVPLLRIPSEWYLTVVCLSVLHPSLRVGPDNYRPNSPRLFQVANANLCHVDTPPRKNQVSPHSYFNQINENVSLTPLNLNLRRYLTDNTALEIRSSLITWLLGVWAVCKREEIRSV
ncbi:hypothetical protein RUM44_001804 [Polyplax serrata]|uniref:Uncharacterized protein n=1 Tax=Polyplax serrata TaxID=468196 RepID=A0ABR1ALT1_POLSC